MQRQCGTFSSCALAHVMLQLLSLPSIGRAYSAVLLWCVQIGGDGLGDGIITYVPSSSSLLSSTETAVSCQ